MNFVPDDIDTIIGWQFTRMPMVSQRIKDIFGKEASREINQMNV